VFCFTQCLPRLLDEFFGKRHAPHTHIRRSHCCECQPHAHGFFTVDQPPAQNQIERVGATDQADEPLRTARTRYQPKFRFGQTQRRFFGDNTEIASHRQFKPAAGGNAASFTVPTTDAGTKNVTVKVSVTGPDSTATSNPVAVTVKPLTPPTIRFAVAPATMPYGNTAALAAQATGSECGGPATVRYTGEGVTGTAFDSKALAFDMSNRLRAQSRTVRLTATATDQKNQTAAANADVTVTLKSEARRLDDIVFPQMSARVNNCAKRVLLEQLTPMLRNDPQAKVILIGHRDEAEKGRLGSKMDEARVINAAAVLSAGTGICPQLDLSRIMWKAAGTDQSAETRPALCGTSTDVKELGRSAIKGTDKKVQFRRVEIWIVPGGADMPAGLTGLQAVPEKDVKTKGCPK